MAKNTYTVTELTDDLDGGKADRTIAFSVEGQSYEIDLSKKNAAAFEKAFATYIASARKVAARRTSFNTSKARSSSNKERLSSIRAWAKENGLDVSERGRIAQATQDAYDAAH